MVMFRPCNRAFSLLTLHASFRTAKLSPLVGKWFDSCGVGITSAATDGGTMTCRLASLTLVCLVLLSAGAWAQESASSSISGQVIDSTKGAMPGATVTVTNLGTNAQRTAVTDAEGRFSVP